MLATARLRPRRSPGQSRQYLPGEAPLNDSALGFKDALPHCPGGGMSLVVPAGRCHPAWLLWGQLAEMGDVP